MHILARVMSHRRKKRPFLQRSGKEPRRKRSRDSEVEAQDFPARHDEPGAICKLLKDCVCAGVARSGCMGYGSG